jgi:acetyltransferase EpsM
MQIPEREKLVVWGASGHALVVADIVRLQGKYEIVGFLNDANIDRQGSEFGRGEVLGGSEQLRVLLGAGVKNLILGVGDCKARLRMAAAANELDFKLAVAIHPQAIVARDVTIEPGTVVAAGVVINRNGVVA